MCGIAGYFGKGNKAILEAMTTSLKHRGPDDAGYFVGSDVGLGHRRLSIIDVSPTGHQPMMNRDGTIALVFNGEIYNYRDLRINLERAGCRFRGTSDTEALLYLYEREGVDCFNKLNGMFAVGIYDGRSNSLVLARDRLGKKPLYWSRQSETVLFGSELKALLRHPLFKREIDLESFNMYLALDYIPTPFSVFRNTYKLEPGTAITIKGDRIVRKQFWDITFGAGPEAVELSRHRNERALLVAMEKHVERAVADRLVADVPVGVFLSGGLDSSTVAYYAQKQSARPIKTFSIGFTEKSYDERVYARTVANQLHTDHYEHVVTASDMLDLIPNLCTYLDEPLADYSCIPTFFLSHFTRQHVTVALGGDGGDELFLGYDTFKAEKIVQLMGGITPFLATIISGLQKVMPATHGYFNTGFKLQRLRAGLAAPAAYRHHRWMGTFDWAAKRRLVNPEVWRTLEAHNDLAFLDTYAKQINKEPRFNQLVYLYLRTYLMDQVLVKVDRMSMANALEVRAPFLDYTFVDFVNSIDYTLKMPRLTTKYLLKKLMSDKLPQSIVYRKKHGFGVPLSRWLAGELQPWMRSILNSEALAATNLFNPIEVKRLMDDHVARRGDYRKELWSLIVWRLWEMAWLRK